MRGLVDDLHAALRSLEAASEFYPRLDDEKLDMLSPGIEHELEAMVSSMHAELREAELGIYRAIGHITDAAWDGVIKRVSDAIENTPPDVEPKQGACDVLIVDDDHEVGELLAAYLATKHVPTRVLRASKDYLADIHAANPRLLLLDVALSDANGYELCTRIKQDKRTRHVKVLLFTAMPLAQVIDRLPASMADGYLLKPFTLIDVDRAIGISGP